jgi:hypothetical protein
VTVSAIQKEALKMKTVLSDVTRVGGAIDVDDGRNALAVVGGGATLLLLGRIVGSSFLRTVGALAALAGAALYLRQRIAERNRRIGEAAEHIRAELDDLDPVAKAQVVADLTRDQLDG